MFGHYHEGKHIFGTVKVGEHGQIGIPKEARDILAIGPGESLLVLGDEKRGIAIVKSRGVSQDCPLDAEDV